MQNDELIAALERAADQMEHLGSNPNIAFFGECFRADAALIRQHIETLRAGGERAQIVAWLRRERASIENWPQIYAAAADAIASGAHLSPRGEGGE